jgi:nicotinamidase-related amidase
LNTLGPKEFAMLMQRDRSALLVVDVQARLMPAIHDHDEVTSAVAWLVDLARELDVPVRASEQYPRGLGATVATLRERLHDDEILEKLHFSCAACPDSAAALRDLGRQQFVLCGVEAHVCVLQTALGLSDAGHEVFVVADAVGSRHPQDKALALARMNAAGVTTVGREMVAFEWLGRAGTDEFRRVSRQFLR